MSDIVVPLPDRELAAVWADLASASFGGGCRHHLLSLLREDASIYRGRSTTEAERLRAFIMAGIARVGPADELVPYILEELETGTSPYAVAAAARAARSASSLPEETAELLAGAIDRIHHLDEFVHLDTYPAPPGAGPTTAIGELIETLAVAGPSGHAAIKALWDRAADGSYLSRNAMRLLEDALRKQEQPRACCAHSDEAPAAEPQPIARSIADLRDIELQNQDGIRASFGQIFAGRASLIVFFYTRCMNPNKCSRTISKLARVHDLIGQRLAESAAMVAGITYDPEYDLPERLRRYGADRGLSFGERCQLLRSTGSFATIRDRLQLGVGYSSSTVNRHRIELILVDPAGRIVDFKVRRLWDEYEMADILVTIATNLAARSGAACCM